MNVSIVIPCYNVASYLEECLESVRAISSEIPVFLVDNNSTDATAHVMASLSEKDAAVQCLQEAVPGAPAARNRGLALVQTEWVQFLDADDLLLPNAFVSRDKPGKDVVVGAYVRRAVGGGEHTCTPNSDIWQGLFATDFGITSSIVWRTEKVREVAGWDVQLKSSQEYDLMFRCMQIGAQIRGVDVPTAVVRERASGQISQTDPAARWHRYLDLRGRMLEHLETNESAYFLANQKVLYQQLFDHIRTLSNADPKGAISRYATMMPSDFVPEASAATGGGFLKLMRLVGFANATRIRRLLP